MATPREFHDRLTEGKAEKLAEILAGMTPQQAEQMASLLYRECQMSNLLLRAMANVVGKEVFAGPTRAKGRLKPDVPAVTWKEAEQKFAGQQAFAYAYYDSFRNLRSGMDLDKAVFEACENENLRQPGDVEKVKAAVQQRLTPQV